MIRRPRRSTLFPYTTLSRSEVELVHLVFAGEHVAASPFEVDVLPDPFIEIARADRQAVAREDRRDAHRHLAAVRSEEHTSELQSLAYLVCRLLLEKKKTATE